MFKGWAPDGSEERRDPEDELWQAAVTGKDGRSDNVRWCYDDEEYSFTGLTEAVLREQGDENPHPSNVYWYWTHPEFDHRNLTDLRENEVTAYHRTE